MDPSRNLLPRLVAGTLGGLLPQGEVLPFGAFPPLIAIEISACCRFGNLGQCVLFRTYTNGLFSPPLLKHLSACTVLLCWILGSRLARAIASVSPVPRTHALPEG